MSAVDYIVQDREYLDLCACSCPLLPGVHAAGTCGSADSATSTDTRKG